MERLGFGARVKTMVSPGWACSSFGIEGIEAPVLALGADVVDQHVPGLRPGTGVAGCAPITEVPCCSPAGVASCAPTTRPSWPNGATMVATRTRARAARWCHCEFIESSSANTTNGRTLWVSTPTKCIQVSSALVSIALAPRCQDSGTAAGWSDGPCPGWNLGATLRLKAAPFASIESRIWWVD